MTKAKTAEAVRERERERESTNIECSLVKHGSISNLIKIHGSRNTFIGDIKKRQTINMNSLSFLRLKEKERRI